MNFLIVNLLLKMKNILLVGDPHFKVSNPLESQQFHDEVLKNIKNLEKQIDFIVILGDILDTHEKIHIQTGTNILHIRSGGVNYANSFYLDGEYLIYGGT